MSDYTQTNIGTGYNASSSINTELSGVATAIASKMDKSGTTMTGDLDMNSNQILNLPKPVAPNDPVRLQDVAIGSITVVSSAASLVKIDTYIPDGVVKATTDVSSYIALAFTQALLTNSTVVGDGGTYYISNTVVITTSCDLENCTFEWHGGNSRAVVVASGSAGSLQTAETPTSAVYPDDYLLDKTIKLGTITNADHVTQDGWPSQGIGLSFSTIYHSRLGFRVIEGFTTGLKISPPNAGFSYNETHMGEFLNNKIGLEEAPLSKGWANSNTYYQGRYQLNSAENPNVDGSPISGTVHHKQAVGLVHIPNNNVYLNPSYEGSHEETAIDISGNQNTWIRPRLEGGSGRSSNNKLDRAFTALKFFPTLANTTTYTITLDQMGGTGVAATYISDGTATTAEVADGIRDAINGEALLSPWVTARTIATAVYVESNNTDRRITFDPVVQDSHLYQITLKAVDGANVTVGYTSGVGATDAEIVNALVIAINTDVTLNTIMVAVNTLNELVVDTLTSKGFTYVSMTGTDFKLKDRWRPEVGFLYFNDAAQFGTMAANVNTAGTNGSISNASYAMGTSTGGSEKQIIFRSTAQDNALQEAGIGLFTVGDTNYTDVNMIVINEVGADGNEIVHSTGSYHEGESLVPVHRHTSKLDASPVFAFYDRQDDMYEASGANYSAAIRNDSFQTFESAGDIEPSLEMKGRLLKFNNIVDDDGTEAEANLFMVRTADYPGGILWLSGTYNSLAAWDAGAGASGALDTKNFQGIYIANPHWNGAHINLKDFSFCLDSTATLLRTTTSGMTQEDDGYVMSRPLFGNTPLTTAFAIANGQAKIIDASAGQVDITLPTTPLLANKTCFFIRDQSGGATATYANLLYDSTNLIMGGAVDYLLDVPNFRYEVVWVGGTTGWFVTNA